MPSLTHVSYWSDEGWKHIDAEELKKIHPYTISAESQQLICRLCNQYVAFSCGYCNSPYFKHTSCSASDLCPDKTESYSSCTSLRSINHDSFPIRIRINSSNTFSFELGVTLPLFKKISSKQFTIITDRDRFIYDTDRIMQFGITYFDVGNVSSNRYILSFDDPNDNDIPSNYTGFMYPALFDGKSRKKLPLNADVIPNHEYYLVTFERLGNYGTIDIKLICSNGLVNLYTVSANTISKEASDFFINHRAFLTETPIDLTAVWPVHIMTPYVIKHKSDNVWFYVSGNHSFFRSFPNNMILSDPSSDVIRLWCSLRQQLVAVGHTQILKYTYLIYDNQNKNSKKPDIVISNINGEVLEEHVYNKLPPKHLISVKAPYDGSVKVESKGKIINIIPLKADKQIDIYNIAFDQTISVYQGFDLIKQVSFERDQSNAFSDDELLKLLKSNKGKKIKIPQRFGAVILKLKDYPKSCECLKECLSQGELCELAYLQIKKMLN